MHVFKSSNGKYLKKNHIAQKNNFLLVDFLKLKNKFWVKQKQFIIYRQFILEVSSHKKKYKF